eukprot:31015-Pelagococcus_subviridis.AAC.8
MLRASLATLRRGARAGVASPATQLQQIRRLNIHEYQARVDRTAARALIPRTRVGRGARRRRATRAPSIVRRSERSLTRQLRSPPPHPAERGADGSVRRPRPPRDRVHDPGRGRRRGGEAQRRIRRGSREEPGARARASVRPSLARSSRSVGSSVRSSIEKANETPRRLPDSPPTPRRRRARFHPRLARVPSRSSPAAAASARSRPGSRAACTSSPPRKPRRSPRRCSARRSSRNKPARRASRSTRSWSRRR